MDVIYIEVSSPCALLIATRLAPRDYEKYDISEIEYSRDLLSHIEQSEGVFKLLELHQLPESIRTDFDFKRKYLDTNSFVMAYSHKTVDEILLKIMECRKSLPAEIDKVQSVGNELEAERYYGAYRLLDKLEKQIWNFLYKL